MKIKYIRISFFVTMIQVLLLSCKVTTYSQQDPFYQDIGDWDHARIPLIKPYYIVYLGKEYAWQMPLQANPPSADTYYYYELHDIRKMAVEKDVILIYTPYIEPVDTSVGHKIFHWFVIVPNQNIEKGFETETDFSNYIQSYDIQKPSWTDPDTIYQRLSKTGCLDWIPDCK